MTTVIRRSPYNSRTVSEALRMSLGLTLKGNKVSVVFVEDGVYLLMENSDGAINDPDMMKHIEALKAFDCRLIAEYESLKRRGISAPISEVTVKNQKAVDQTLQESDRVIVI